jgi:hypothetical protein
MKPVRPLVDGDNTTVAAITPVVVVVEVVALTAAAVDGAVRT